MAYDPGLVLLLVPRKCQLVHSLKWRPSDLDLCRYLSCEFLLVFFDVDKSNLFICGISSRYLSTYCLILVPHTTFVEGHFPDDSKGECFGAWTKVEPSSGVSKDARRQAWKVVEREEDEHEALRFLERTIKEREVDVLVGDHLLKPEDSPVERENEMFYHDVWGREDGRCDTLLVCQWWNIVEIVSDNEREQC